MINKAKKSKKSVSMTGELLNMPSYFLSLYTHMLYVTMAVHNDNVEWQCNVEWQYTMTVYNEETQ